MTHTDLSDEDLLVQAGAGDRRAAAVLVRRHSNRVMAVAARMLNNQAEAEDVTQEVFLRTWRMADKWKTGQAKLTTWMHTVTVNLCIDRLRKPKFANSDDVPEMSDTSATPAQNVEREEQAKQVRNALSKLPDRQRAAVILCYFQECTNIEAAKILKVSVDALESLLARGRRGLKAHLTDAGIELLGEAPAGRSSGFVG